MTAITRVMWLTGLRVSRRYDSNHLGDVVNGFTGDQAV